MQRRFNVWRPGGHTCSANKENIKRFSYRAPGNMQNKGTYAELRILAGIKIMKIW